MKDLSMDADRLLNLGEAAEFLGISPDSMYTLRRCRRVAFHRVGRKLRFRRSDLEAYLESCRVEAADV